MHRKSYLVSATEVRPSVMNLLDHCTKDAVQVLRDACLKGGSIDGGRFDTCIKGTLAKASGYDFRDKTSEQVRETLGQFGRDIDVEIDADDEPDLIDQYCFEVYRSHTYLTSDVLANFLQWCDQSLDKKKDERRIQELYEIAEDMVGV